jgi:hypothetical protein
LFGLGLELQSAASRTTAPEMRGLIETQIDEVDVIIREIRATVFALSRHTTPGPEADGGGPADGRS